MRRLPEWVMTNKFPSVYDSESGTAIEMVAKVYGAMQNLITEYNQFAETVNQNIESFEGDIQKEFEEFTVGMQQAFQDFIDVVDLKIGDAESFVKNNMNEALNTAIANGSLRITGVYNNATESYDLKLTGGV